MNLNIQARLVNKETKEVHCFKHAVQAVMLEQQEFDFELDDFSSHLVEPPCVKCNPDHYDFGDYDCGEDEVAVVSNEKGPGFPIGYFKKFPETVEEKTKEEIKTKGFAIKSKIKKGR